MQKVLKLVWDEFVYGGHILSLGAISIVLAYSILNGIRIDWAFALIVYFGIHSLYLFNRHKESSQDTITNQARTGHLRKKRAVPYQIIFSLIIVVVLVCIFGNLSSLILALILILCGFAYTKLIKPLTVRIIGLKNFFVPLPYALLVVLFAFYYRQTISLELILFAIFIYVRLFIATAFYDLKDIESDKSAGIKTLAVAMSDRGLSYAMTALNLLSAIPIILGVVLGVFPIYSLSLSFLLIYFWVYHAYSKKVKDISLYSYIFCDGEYLLWAPIIFLAKATWN